MGVYGVDGKLLSHFQNINSNIMLFLSNAMSPGRKFRADLNTALNEVIVSL